MKAYPFKREGRVRGTKPVVIDGIRFDSTREAKRWQELRLLERAGEITGLERQVPIGLVGQLDSIRTPTGRQMQYVADFRYFDMKLKAWVIEDAKGAYETETFKIKRAILEAMGIELELV